MLSWEIITTIAVTAMISGACNAISQYFIYRLFLKHVDKIRFVNDLNRVSPDDKAISSPNSGKGPG